MVRFHEDTPPRLEAAFPIGFVYISTVATNPAGLLGFGVWQAIGAGRVLVGIDPTQEEFDTLGETGGAKEVTLTTAQMPSHTHVQDSHNHVQNAHQHTALTASNAAGTSGANFTRGSGSQATLATTNATATNQAATATNQNTGGGQPHTNLMPYRVVHMWERTA